MAILRNLLVKIGFDIKDDDLKKLDKNVTAVKKSILHLGEFAAGAAASIFGLSLATAKYGEDLGDTAELIGINTTELQKLQYAAKMTDTSVEEFNNSMLRMSRLQTAAAMGQKDAVSTFNLLGVSIRNSNGSLKDQSTLFKEIADKFHSIHSTQVKAAMAFKIFGRGSTDIIKTLNLGKKGIEEYGKELEKTGYILSPEQIEKSSKFIDSWRQGTTAIQGFRNMLGLSVMPMVDEVMQKMLDYWRENKVQIETTVNNVLPTLESFFKGFVGFLDITFGALGGVVDAVGGLNNALMIAGSLVGVLVSYKIAGMLWAILKPLVLINIAMAANPIGAIIVGVEILLGLTYLVWKYWKEIVEFFKHPVDAIRGKGYFSDEEKKKRSNQDFANSVRSFQLNANPNISAEDLIGTNKAVGGNKVNNVTANTTINLTVPPGTSQDQQSFINDATSQAFDSLHANLAQHILNGYPARGG